MPPTPKRQVPRGPGSFVPDFTSQVAVQQAGPVATEQPTPFQQLEQTLLSIGSSVSGVVTTAAQNQRQLAAMKDRAVARSEQIIAGVRRSQVAVRSSLQQRRLQDVHNRQLELIARAEQHDPEWLHRQRLG